MSNAKGTTKNDSNTINELLAKMEAMQAMLEEKETQIAELATKIKPSKRQRINYKVLEYFTSIHTELKNGKADKNGKGLLDRDFSSVLSYIYPKPDETVRVRDYYQPLEIATVQRLLLEDMRDFLIANRETVAEWFAETDGSIVAFNSEQIEPLEHVVINASNGK